MSRHRPPILLASLALAAAARAQGTYVNFEGALTRPIAITPDGTRLLVVDTPDARLSVFSLGQPWLPLPAMEIPVGIEPVSVTPHGISECWVVNQESDSVSVVSLTRGIVTDTIQVKDEPADVVFANGKAFVSAARSNAVRVFDATTHAPLGTIALQGDNPRALAVNGSGTRVYAAFALSGNHTTLIPAPNAPPPPPPWNPNLPPAPQVSLIVDATDPAWYPGFIQYTMPDNDVAEIDSATLAVSRYFQGVGTVNLGLALRPLTDDVYVASTEARNLVRFQPNVRGHFIDSRVSKIASGSGAVTRWDLNPTIDYGILPNPAARAIALSQPTSIVFPPGGATMYVASFGTDRVARVDSATGAVMARIEIGSAIGPNADPRTKRGPRGLAYLAAPKALYVMNRISNTVSVVDTAQDRVVTEIPVGGYDPTPPAIKVGRGFLYDAKLSGNGTGACASCHVDAEMDKLAWDLGDPSGDLETAVDPNNGQSFTLHPMKGPMTTQTLRGLQGVAPYHWRGDRASFLDFNPAFDKLMGNVPLSTADMTAFRDYVNTIAYMPNPNQNLDRTLPATFAGGDPNAGRNTFLNEPFAPNNTRCQSCHVTPGPGTNRAIIPAQVLGLPQDFKVAHLRDVYQKLGFNPAPGAASIDGFGIANDGVDPTIFGFLSRPFFGPFANDTVRKTNLSAYVQCFDTGMAPAVGYTRTITPANVGQPQVMADWSLLQAQAATNIDLIAKGTIGGWKHGLVYQPATQTYRSDKTGLGPFTQAQLQAKIQAGDTLSFMGVPRGSGTRMGIDRNQDGVLDGD